MTTAPKNLPVRIQRKKLKGWRMPPDTVYVGRPTKWGSAFLVVPDCPPQIAVVNFAIMLDEHDHAEIRETLYGKNLCCWCPLNQPCHADVLLKIANDQGSFDEDSQKLLAVLGAHPKGADLRNVIKEYGALISPPSHPFL